MTQPALPIGPFVDPDPALRPERVTLTGRFVTLVPLEADHADALFDAACGPGRDDLWTYMFDGPFSDRAVFAANIAQKAASTDPLFFAIVDNGSRRVVGHAALMRIDVVHRVIEVGNIMFGAPLQRTPGATESMALLARYVFETLGYRRYEWKCNAMNEPSRVAAHRLGFTFEGVFRQHMIVKGRNRDTAWFSILDTEWPACGSAFEGWLAAGNFDADGRQRRSLAALRPSTT
ncbi:GNAT family N-acetyltransferase [Lichenihabitans psoromatis]|uniref:GNAT family N-acetyltransferase n=1 Tax=Lichenihabitans psoromatis TaxID=2528642 RepID=UPI001035E31E|nr:GNAT family protein [Lichenihabitans psoromatis]